MSSKKVLAKKPIKTATTKKVIASTPEQEPEPEPESEPIVEDTGAEESVAGDDQSDDLLEQIDEEIAGLEAMRKDLTNRIQSLRKIRKGVNSAVKKLNKKKHAKKNNNKTPSGINMAYPVDDVSKILSSFMKSHSENKNIETISRIDALKAINKYVKDKNLQNKTKKTEINMDATLKKLFPTLAEQGNPLTFTGIMKPLGQHFPQSNKSQSSSSS